MKYYLFLLLIFLTACGNELPKDFSFLVGSWIMETSDSTSIIEKWEKDENGNFNALVYNNSPAGMKLNEEAQLIFTDTGIVYKVALEDVYDGNPFYFRYVKFEKGKYIFENMTYDFPCRIWYEPKGKNILRAAAENNDASEQQKFIYQRVVK